MKRHTALLGAVALLLAGSAGLHAATFGPGDHWVDTVTEGTYTAAIEGSFDATILGVGAVSFGASGQMTVWHGDAQDTPDPLDPAHLNQVDVEIVSMTLTGNAPGVGPVTLTAGDGVANGLNDGPLFSGGTVIEAPGDPALADSFFDIFFQVAIPAYPLTIFNKLPLQVSAQIDRIPPVGFAYVSVGPVNLYDAQNPDGPAMAQMTGATYTPEPSSLAVVGIGTVVLLVRRRRKHLRPPKP